LPESKKVDEKQKTNSSYSSGCFLSSLCMSQLLS